MAKLTQNYSLKKPLGTEKIDVNVLNENFDAIDEALTPSVSQGTAPTSSAHKGKISVVVGWLANRIKAITGCSNWFDTPATTLAKCNSHIVSGTHSNATASKSGFMSASDKQKLDSADRKLADYENSSYKFTTALGTDVLAEIPDSSLCVIADIMFCRHMQPGLSVCGRAKIQFFPGATEEDMRGSVQVTDVVGTHKYKDELCGYLGIIKHTDGTYYVSFYSNFGSLDNTFEYKISGLNIKPITPKHMYYSDYKFIVNDSIYIREE